MAMVMGMAKGTDTNKVYYQPSNWDWLAKKRKETFKFVIKKKKFVIKNLLYSYTFFLFTVLKI